MADNPRLDLVYKAIKATFGGNVQWKDSAARLVRLDSELCGMTPSGIKKLLREFDLNGGTVSPRVETREEYKDRTPHWYRARIAVDELPRELFIELTLIDPNEEEEPFVEIVSAHLQRS